MTGYRRRVRLVCSVQVKGDGQGRGMTRPEQEVVAVKTNVEKKYQLRLTTLPIFLLLAVVLSIAVTAAVDAEDKYVHSMIVYRHTDVFVTDEYVDAMFAGASGLLETDADACPDEVGCPVELRRLGDLGTFGLSGDEHDIITDQAELDWVFAQPGDFKVVRNLSTQL